MKQKMLNIILFSSLCSSLFLLDSCQPKKDDQDVDNDAQKIKKSLDELMKNLNIKSFKELRDLLVNYKKNDIKVLNELLNILNVKDLDSAIKAIDDLITKQNNSKKAHALSCFMFDVKGIISYEELLSKFDDEKWKNQYENEIKELCKKLEIETKQFNSNLQIDKKIVTLAEEYAKNILPSFQKMVQNEKDVFVSEYTSEINNEIEKENGRVWVFACFILEQDAKLSIDELRRKFASQDYWKNKDSNEIEIIKKIFNLQNIESLDLSMLNDSLVDKAKKIAEIYRDFYEKEFANQKEKIISKLKAQHDKESKQVWLLFQFLLEKNATEFNEQLKNELFQNWKQDHNQEICEAFGLVEINNFEPSILQQAIIEKAQTYAKKVSVFYEKEFANQKEKIISELEKAKEKEFANQKEKIISKLKAQNDKESKQVWLLFQFLLEKNATEFNEQLKNELFQNWKQDHNQEICEAFGLVEINNFEPSILQQTIIEKAQTYAKKVSVFYEKEFANQKEKIISKLKAQNDKESKQVWLLFQFLLEKNATEFNEQLKNELFQNWKQDHNQEICEAFDLTEINLFHENMITRNIINKVNTLLNIYHPRYQNMLEARVKEFIAKGIGDDSESKKFISNNKNKIQTLITLLGVENLDEAIIKLNKIIKPKIDELMKAFGVINYDELEQEIELIIDWIDLIDRLKIEKIDDLTENIMRMISQNDIFMELVKIFDTQDQNIEKLSKKINNYDLEGITKITHSVNNLIDELGCSNFIELKNKISSFSKNEINRANFLFDLIKEYKITNIEKFLSIVVFQQNEIDIDKFFILFNFYKKWNILDFSNYEIAWVDFIHAWKIKFTNENIKQKIEDLMIQQEFENKNVEMLKKLDITKNKNDQIQSLINLMKIHGIKKISDLKKIVIPQEQYDQYKINKLQDLLNLMETINIKNFVELKNYFYNPEVSNDLAKIQNLLETYKIHDFSKLKNTIIVLTKNEVEKINDLLFLMSKCNVNSIEELENKSKKFYSRLLFDKAQSIATFAYCNDVFNYCDNFDTIYKKIILLLQDEKFKNENVETMHEKIGNLNTQLIVNLLVYFMIDTNSDNWQDLTQYFDNVDWKNEQWKNLKNLAIVLGIDEGNLTSEKIANLDNAIKDQVLILKQQLQKDYFEDEHKNNIKKLIYEFNQFKSFEKLMDVYQMKTTKKLNIYLNDELLTLSKEYDKDDKNILSYLLNILIKFKCRTIGELWQKLDSDDTKIKLWVNLLKDLNLLNLDGKEVQSKIQQPGPLVKGAIETDSKDIESFLEKFKFFAFAYLMNLNKIGNFENFFRAREIGKKIPNLDFLLEVLNKYGWDIEKLIMEFYCVDQNYDGTNVYDNRWQDYLQLFFDLMNASENIKIGNLIKKIKSYKNFWWIFFYFDEFNNKDIAWVNFINSSKVNFTNENIKQKIENLMQQQEFKNKNINMLQAMLDTDENKNNQLQVLVDLMKVHGIEKISDLEKIVIPHKQDEINKLQNLLNLMNLCKAKNFIDLKSKINIFNNYGTLQNQININELNEFISFMEDKNRSEFYDLIFGIMHKLNFKKINDFEKNQNEINNYFKILNFTNEYGINDQDEIDNLFFEWVNFDQSVFGFKTKEIIEIFKIWGKGGSIFKKDNDKINTFISCINAWNVTNSKELIKEINGKIWVLIDLMNILGEDIISGYKKLYDEIKTNKQNEKKYEQALNLMKQLFGSNDTKSLNKKIFDYYDFLNNQSENITFDKKNLYDFHENILILLAKSQNLKKMMDIFGVKTCKELEKEIDSLAKKEIDIINYMLDNKINTIEEIQQKFNNMINAIYKPKYALEKLDNLDSLNNEEIVNLKNEIINLIKIQVDEIPYQPLFSLLFKGKYTWKEIDNIIHENYLLMEIFEIDIFDKLPQKITSLSKLKILLEKWNIKNIDVLIKKLNNTKHEFENYYDYYKYLQGVHKKSNAISLEEMDKDFKNLPKNKQWELFEIIRTLLDINIAASENHNEKNIKMYDEFKNEMNDLINDFIEKANNNLRKKWVKKRGTNIEKIIKEYDHEGDIDL